MFTNIINPYIQKLEPLETNQIFEGNLPQPVKAVLFDIYGTLLISGSGDISTSQKELVNLEGLAKLLKKYDIATDPNNILITFHEEIRKSHQDSKLKGIDYPEVTIEHIWQNTLNIYDEDILQNFSLEYELTVNPVYPMPNFTEIIKKCSRQNIKLGIISNAQFFTPVLLEYFLKKKLTEAGFNEDLIFFSYKYEYAKPSTYLFKKAIYALSKYNIPAKNSLYVGNDMLNDIYPAQQTNFMTALFAGDTRSLRLRKDDKHTKNLKPNLTITNLNQLLCKSNP